VAKKKTGTADAGPSKMSLVRAALAELGSDAKPKGLGEFIKAKHGVDIQPGMLSAYKSTITGGGASKSRARIGGSSAGVRIGDLEDVKALVHRLGAKQLGDLVSILAK
jgi:hypothetical protein